MQSLQPPGLPELTEAATTKRRAGTREAQSKLADLC
eukprot:CAMPEP_0204351694 /NCGR_PEP_ID=MMETSP0469-20131031/31317_1 /ASSEMBLY_ACC=CAM_ASM_000384 /TAXON_ID=2969 /ORGANISM="Oxyrrhis marina" /LENGTH=35 /DNA_ID= /DNA_START= /DNA_END= /DNA_ORIENTATION=